ncbi:MAG TPA: hypothetical protein VJV79_34195 [Polyangiaceae bacterium]|nr:hypothetical protein [Polyangiaceae bacterium]
MAALLIALTSIQACGKPKSRPAQPATQVDPVQANRIPEPDPVDDPGAPLSPELEEIVAGIAEGDRVESSTVGLAGRSSQWPKYERLKELATVPQLIGLTDHENAAVRCYSFQALAAKSSARVFDVLLKHLRDNEQVSTQQGCVGGTELTGDYFVEIVTMGAVEPSTYQLNGTERARLDYILLNDQSVKLRARSRTLRALKPTPGDYARVRQLASDDRSGEALRVLAKYQRSADVELITTFFWRESEELKALYAAREFPDDSFYPLVTKIFEQEWGQELYDYPKWRLCYQVLARYPRPETLRLFERTLKATDPFRHQMLSGYLLVAINKYPNALFEPLKAQIALGQHANLRADLEDDD